MFLRTSAAIVGAVLVLTGCGSDGGETTAENEPRTESSPADTPLEGNKLTVTHSAGSNDFRWSVDGDTLRPRWLKTIKDVA